MSSLEIIMSILFTAMTAGGIVWVYRRHHRAIDEARRDPLPHEVRERSHQIKNEVTAVRAPLRRIAESHDPLSELARAIRRDRSGDD